MKVELEVSMPEGYEATGEFRRVTRKDMFLHRDGTCADTWRHNDSSCDKYIILRKVEVPKKMRPMTEMEVLRILTTPYCITRNAGSEDWVPFRINQKHAASYEYGFVREDGTVDGPYKFEKECEECRP